MSFQSEQYPLRLYFRNRFYSVLREKYDWSPHIVPKIPLSLIFHTFSTGRLMVHFCEWKESQLIWLLKRLGTMCIYEHIERVSRNLGPQTYWTHQIEERMQLSVLYPMKWWTFNTEILWLYHNLALETWYVYQVLGIAQVSSVFIYQCRLLTPFWTMFSLITLDFAALLWNYSSGH